MIRGWLAGALVTLLATPALAQIRPLPPPVLAPPPAPPALNPAPIQLPRAPATISASANQTLLAAMLAIENAERVDPNAAQTASFQYTQAVQQYRAGDAASARRSALLALSTANQAQVRPVVSAAPAPSDGPAAIAANGSTLGGVTAPEVDADSFLALARGTIADCAGRHDRRVAAARAAYARAADAFAAGNWEVTRLAAKAAIDACAVPQR